ncbi:hypothetical protein G6F65_017461 [Rhizopus arrhizus]|nr:hypothetical protein G6F65_017461 [Rhizopus arrhizus]
MVEIGRVGVVQLHMGFVAGQAQQEPDLLLADADLPLVAADGPRRQLVAQPAGCRAEHFHMLRQQAGLFLQFTIHGLDRRLVGIHATLRELPAVPAHTSCPEHLTILPHQHDADVRSIAVRIDHDADS